MKLGLHSFLKETKGWPQMLDDLPWQVKHLYRWWIGMENRGLRTPAPNMQTHDQLQ